MREKGRVILTGAGCSADHITLAALKWIRLADVIIYDALLDETILGYSGKNCEKIYAGKRSGKHGMKQEDINALIYEKAVNGSLVVRLKGGDGFVFGRGGEELEYLRDKGIECAIIPGISSAIAVPEYFGIPVSHRGMASSFCVVTAHEASGDRNDYAYLASFKGTLIFLMGGTRIKEVAGKLLENGMPKDTPAAVLSKGFRAGAKRVNARLKDLPDITEEIETPAILVVGKTAALDLLNNAIHSPGVHVTGTKSFTDKVAGAFEQRGIPAEALVSLNVVTLPGSIPDSFREYDWLVFTSANGVDVFFKGFSEMGLDLRMLGHVRFACVGSGTAGRLLHYGFRADLVPEDQCVRALGRVLSEKVSKGARILILRSRKAGDGICEELEQAGVKYDDIRIYDTEHMRISAPEEGYVVFGSADGVRAFFENPADETGLKYVCIGKETAEELEKHTAKSCIIPEHQSAECIVRAVMEDISG